MRDFMKGTLKFLGALAMLLGVALGILYAFFVKLVDIGHNGMAPTMLVGDRVAVWNTQELALGDIALCSHPSEPGRFVLGRVVGRPGQVVSLDRGMLRINGEAPEMDLRGTVAFDDAETGRRSTMHLALEEILEHEHSVFWLEHAPPRMVRPHTVRGGVFLLGDNRSHRGEDSRDFGEVDPATCVGTVFLRVKAAPSPPEIGNAAFERIE